MSDLLIEARGWLSDIDVDPELIHDRSAYADSRICQLIGRYYDGGWNQFLTHNP